MTFEFSNESEQCCIANAALAILRSLLIVKCSTRMKKISGLKIL